MADGKTNEKKFNMGFNFVITRQDAPNGDQPFCKGSMEWSGLSYEKVVTIEGMLLGAVGQLHGIGEASVKATPSSSSDSTEITSLDSEI